MAKKVKLSSREQAAKEKGGTLNYKTGKVTVAPKVSSRAVASKAPVATGPAIGPLMPGQIRSNSGPAIGPLLPNQTRATTVPSKSSSSSRDLASKAQKSKSSSLLSKASDLAGSAGAALRKVPGLKQIGEYGDDYVNTGNKASLGKVMAPFVAGAAIPAGMFAAGAGAAGSGMASLAGVGRGVIGRGIGSLGRGVKNTMGEIAEGAAARLPVSALPTVGATAGGMAAGQLIGAASSLDPVNDKDSYNPDQEMFAGNDPITTDTGSGDGRNDNKKQDEPWVNPWGDVDISGESQPEPSYQQVQNDVYGNNDQAPYDQAPAQVTRQVRGSGLFGTGKGVGNPAGGQDDPYIKELRKAYSSNGGEKWLRKQFEELISALDPTYAQMQKEGTDALNAQLNNDNIKLASVMNANNTGDSEQRAQLMAQQQQGTQTALGNLLAKLAQNKAQDVSGYKSQMADKMGQYRSQQQSNQQRLMEQIQQYRQRQEDQAYKNASLAGRGNTPQKAGTLSYLGDDANGNPVYYNTTTGERTTEAGLKRKQSNPLEEAMAALLGQGGGGGQQVQYDENGRPYIEQ